eukprot:m.203276 g.203276  ORF g.203276 m.203276 type:complete len:259 (+) comp14989_c1_seq1:28-804(+)
MAKTLSVVTLLACTMVATTLAATSVCQNVQTSSMTGTCGGVNFDLSGIVPTKAGFYELADPAGDYDYYLNPSTPLNGETMQYCTFDADTPPNVGFAQGRLDGGGCYYVGLLDQTTWQFDNSSGTDTITISMTGGKLGRSGIVKVTCDPKQSKPLATAESGAGTTVYTIDITHCSACSSGCKGGGSGGTILVAIFFGVLGGYFLFGFVFLKFVQKKEGGEAIPNGTFWGSLPGLIKDGFNFSLSCVRGSTPTGSYETLK